MTASSYVMLALVLPSRPIPLKYALYEVHGFETPAYETWSANCFSACSSFAASVLYESGHFILNSILLYPPAVSKLSRGAYKEALKPLAFIRLRELPLDF